MKTVNSSIKAEINKETKERQKRDRYDLNIKIYDKPQIAYDFKLSYLWFYFIGTTQYLA